MQNPLYSIGKPWRWLMVALYWGYLTYCLCVSNPWAPIYQSVEFSWNYVGEESYSILLHVIAYAVLAGLLIWATAGAKIKIVSFWLLVALLHSIAFEFLQQYVPARSVNPTDFAGNMVGLSLGWGYLTFSRHKPR